jgi:type VI secretion system secreted protein VgrG
MSWDNFLKAFNTTMTFEGGYANDPDDAGGETYMGISRRYHPDWV